MQFIAISPTILENLSECTVEWHYMYLSHRPFKPKSEYQQIVTVFGIIIVIMPHPEAVMELPLHDNISMHMSVLSQIGRIWLAV